MSKHAYIDYLERVADHSLSTLEGLDREIRKLKGWKKRRCQFDIHHFKKTLEMAQDELDLVQELLEEE